MILGLFGTVIASGVLGLLVYHPEASGRVGSPLIYVAALFTCCVSFIHALVRMVAQGEVLRRRTSKPIPDAVILWLVLVAVSVVGFLILRAMFGTS
ncbi:MAG: hypothetical protein K8T90_18805 [Planctomycetes bacterium]|nr:hypothetical protein [Planctomycetota bacterium]